MMVLLKGFVFSKAIVTICKLLIRVCPHILVRSENLLKAQDRGARSGI